MADGPVDVLVAVDSLALVGAAVDVRGAPEIDERVEGVESCFVGDFVGDYKEHSSEPDRSNIKVGDPVQYIPSKKTEGLLSAQA